MLNYGIYYDTNGARHYVINGIRYKDLLGGMLLRLKDNKKIPVLNFGSPSFESYYFNTLRGLRTNSFNSKMNSVSNSNNQINSLIQTNQSRGRETQTDNITRSYNLLGIPISNNSLQLNNNLSQVQNNNLQLSNQQQNIQQQQSLNRQQNTRQSNRQQSNQQQNTLRPRTNWLEQWNNFVSSLSPADRAILDDNNISTAAKLQQFLIDQGIDVGRTKADNKWGRNSMRGWLLYKDRLFNNAMLFIPDFDSNIAVFEKHGGLIPRDAVKRFKNRI